MSTPSGAAYNRCRPVPPWNGSSSASRLRRVTTRCSRGYRGARDEGRGARDDGAGSGRQEAGSGKRVTGSWKREARRALVFVGASLFLPALLVSQQPPPTAPSTQI